MSIFRLNAAKVPSSAEKYQSATFVPDCEPFTTRSSWKCFVRMERPITVIIWSPVYTYGPTVRNWLEPVLASLFWPLQSCVHCWPGAAPVEKYTSPGLHVSVVDAVAPTAN